MITDELNKTLFTSEDPIGSIISINGQPVEIIGIYNEINNTMGFTNNGIIIPLLLHQNIYQKTSIDSIEIEAYNSDEIELAGQGCCKYIK